MPGWRQAVPLMLGSASGYGHGVPGHNAAATWQ
jgi:hypothetical protein